MLEFSAQFRGFGSNGGAILLASVCHKLHDSKSNDVSIHDKLGFRVQKQLCYFIFQFFIVVLGGGIYKSSYNVSNMSYLSLPPPLFSCISPPPNSFSRYHFSIYTHVYTVFAPCSPSFTLSHFLLPPTGTNFPDRTCSAFLFSNF
jgi:hypothetical protein